MASLTSFCCLNSSVIKQKGESQNECSKKTKHAKFPKNDYFLSHFLRSCAYQGVKNVRFSENLSCFVFLKYPFWDSPFCLITDELLTLNNFHVLFIYFFCWLWTSNGFNGKSSNRNSLYLHQYLETCWAKKPKFVMVMPNEFYVKCFILNIYRYICWNILNKTVKGVVNFTVCLIPSLSKKFFIIDFNYKLTIEWLQVFCFRQVLDKPL